MDKVNGRPITAEDVDGFLDGVHVSMARGSWVAVNWFLQSQILKRIKEFAPDEVHRRLAGVSEWVAEAREHEAIHGEGSRLVPDHPLNIKLGDILTRKVRIEDEPGSPGIQGDVPLGPAA